MRSKKQARRRARTRQRLKRTAWQGSTFAVGIIVCLAIARISPTYGGCTSSEMRHAAAEEANHVVEDSVAETQLVQMSHDKGMYCLRTAPLMQMWVGETRAELRLECMERTGKAVSVSLYPTGYPSCILYENQSLAPGEKLRYVELAYPLPVGRNPVTVEASSGTLHEKSEVTIDVLPAELRPSGM